MWAEQASCGHIDVHLRSYSWSSDTLVPARGRLRTAVLDSKGCLRGELIAVRDAMSGWQGPGSAGNVAR
jgi:hypothetical protein